MKNMLYSIALAVLVAVSVSHGVVYAHTLDAWGDYRLEITWAHSPAFTGDLNALILYVSPLVPGLELEEQPFENGVVGLEDTLKIQLVSRDSTIMLFLDPDAEIPGVYSAHVRVDRAGYYQANVIGTIGDTPISLSLHPPQVRNSEHITVPQDYDLFHDIYSDQDVMRGSITELYDMYDMYDENVQLYQEYEAQIDALKSRIAELEQSDANMAGQYLGVAVGLVGIGTAILALYRTRSHQQ